MHIKSEALRQSQDENRNTGHVSSQIFDTRIKTYDSAVETEHFKVDVLASSSTANSAVINDLFIIDHGLQSKDFYILMKRKGHLRDKRGRKKRYPLFITHNHFDHCRDDSIPRTMALDDLISEIYASPKPLTLIKGTINGHINGELEDDSYGRVPNGLRMLRDLDELDTMFNVISNNDMIPVGDYIVVPHQVPHTVKTFAYEIIHKPSGARMLYATDLSSTETLPKGPYELIAIENSWSQMMSMPDLHKKSLAGHLSTEEAAQFIIDNLEEGGKYEELHTSGYSVPLSSMIDFIKRAEEMKSKHKKGSK